MLKRNIDARNLIQWVLGGLAVFAVVGYSIFALDDFVRGPRIIISSPLNGFSTTTPLIEIQGKVIHTTNLTINDASTPVDLQGNFSDQLILAPGYNIIKLAGEDTYKRVVEKTIEINLVTNIENAPTSTATTTINIAPFPTATQITLPVKPTNTNECLPGQLYSVLTGEKCTGDAASTTTPETSGVIIN